MSKKNIIFMMNIDLNGEGRFATTRTSAYDYSIDSWKKWASKNDCDIFILTELLMPHSDMGICWQRFYLFDILEANEIEYDQVLMVDADTIVHPECPNFFNMTEHKFSGAVIDGSYDWIFRSIENYAKYAFNGNSMNFWEYIDCGFMIVNEIHKPFFKTITDFYHNNRGTLKELETLHVGTDQTPVNLLRHQTGTEITMLPYEFNMSDMVRKEIVTEDLLFTKCGWIYQYNAMPNNVDNKVQHHWMEKTYKHFYGKLV